MKIILAIIIVFLLTGAAIAEDNATASMKDSLQNQKNLVEVSIYPQNNIMDYGDFAQYTITVKDNHESACIDNSSGCAEKQLRYVIKVLNLPFYKDFESFIEIPPGGMKSLNLTVKPYAKEEGTDIFTKIVLPGRSDIEKPTINPVKKSYEFDVETYLDDDVGIEDSTKAVLEIRPTGDSVDYQVMRLSLYRGWNLISVPGELIRFDAPQKNLLGFIYLKDNQEYADINTPGIDLRAFLVKNAFWVYSNIDQEFTYQYQPYATDIDLDRGWNLVPVTEDMLGGFLGDIIGRCDMDNLNLWNAENQTWEHIEQDYRFTSKDLGKGLIAKSNNICWLIGPRMDLPQAQEGNI